MKKLVLAIACIFVVSACGDDSPDTPSVTKDQAAKQNGKSDNGKDFCAAFGWYGDGICDGFCPNPDPDCDSTGVNCGARAGDTCADDEYCAYEEGEYCGAADAESTCKPTPEFCYEIYAPVCGCDGNTYSNDCYANAAGTGIASLGSCDGSCTTNADCNAGETCDSGTCQAAGPVACGARAGDTCGADEYCAYQDGEHCGAADAQSTCQPRPEACIEIYAPVCGCDGNTYGNDCDAAANGTGVLHIGECGGNTACSSDLECSNGQVCTNGTCEDPASGVQCGARAGDTCQDDEYCAYEEGEYCGAADAQSTCQTRPQFCPEIYAPVCGCDGQTYGNDCDAAANGTGVSHSGECAPQQTICGGFLGQACGDDEYCAYVPGQFCGQADASSTCETRPEACAQIYDPVCGCDGQTYGNACSANAAGQGVYSDGPCEN